MKWEESKVCTPLKRDFLNAWFTRDSSFFLTGGSALGIFYLHHRYSYDLDFFTETGWDHLVLKNQIASVAGHIGASCEPLQTSPDFLRFQLRRGDENEILDFVHDRAPQLDVEKKEFDHIRVDTPREILANKISSLLGRSETKDLIDLYFLHKNGHDIISAIPDAQQKDGGLDPAMLSLLISEFNITTQPDWMAEQIDLNDFREFTSQLCKNLVDLSLNPE